MAATYTVGPERVIDAAIATLTANVAASLAVVAAGTTDGVTLPAPVEIVAGIRRTVPAYPILEVAVPSTDTDDPAVRWFDAASSFPLVVSCHVEDSASVERVYRRMLRYAAAVERILVVPDALGAGVAVTRVRKAYRVDPETREVQERVGLAVVAFEVVDVDRY